MSLYKIDGDILDALEKALASGVDEETGEIIEGSFDEVDALRAEREAKLENIGAYIKNLSAEVDAIDAEVKALKSRQKEKENRIERLKNYVSLSMSNFEQTKFESPRVVFSFRNSEKVNIINLDDVPEEYKTIKTEVSPDKIAIKKAIKAGVAVGGAEVVKSTTLQIK